MIYENVFKAGDFTLPIGFKTYVMGILNVTPDSFSDGGDYTNLGIAVDRAVSIQELGADILDIGAQSTRPGYTVISEDEELSRIIPVLKVLKDKINIPISIDTFYPKVARECMKYGASIINDVSGFKDESMYDVMHDYNCGCIIMHDNPETDIKTFFLERISECQKRGINKSRICLDPGIGFSKTYEENLKIIKNLKELKIAGCATLIGASRKRMIGQACGNPPFKNRMSGTIAAHTIAICNGADIIRVHDVAEGIQAAKVADAILKV